MDIGSLKDHMQQPVEEANILKSIGKGIKKVAKGIGNLIAPSDEYMLKEALKDAKKEGKYYDVKFIQQLLDMNKNLNKGIEPADEGMYYLLKKAYLDQPREIRNLKISDNIHTMGNVYHRDKIRKLENEVEFQKKQALFNRRSNNMYYTR